jgi:transposase-like protein
VSTLVRTIFEQPDAASVRAQHAQVVKALEAKLPQAAAHLDEARDDILAFTGSHAKSGGRSGPTTRRNG